MAQQKSGELNLRWGKIVKKAWKDEDFKRRLLGNPQSVLKEEGLQPAQGVQIKVVEDTPSLAHLILPVKVSGELSEEDFDLVVGGLVGSLMVGRSRPILVP